MIDPVLTRIIETIKEYVSMSKTVTRCRQRHFHYACQSCREYSNAMCPTYRKYVDAWMELQKLVPKEFNDLKGSN